MGRSPADFLTSTAFAALCVLCAAREEPWVLRQGLRSGLSLHPTPNSIRGLGAARTRQRETTGETAGDCGCLQDCLAARAGTFLGADQGSRSRTRGQQGHRPEDARRLAQNRVAEDFEPSVGLGISGTKRLDSPPSSPFLWRQSAFPGHSRTALTSSGRISLRFWHRWP